jgi:hypothetical protein
MFRPGSLGLHVIQFPSGRFCYVGSIPTALGEEVPATKSAILGCRTHRNAEGAIVEWKFPYFDTREAAVAFAVAKGFDPK